MSDELRVSTPPIIVIAKMPSSRKRQYFPSNRSRRRKFLPLTLGDPFFLGSSAHCNERELASANLDSLGRSGSGWARHASPLEVTSRTLGLHSPYYLDPKKHLSRKRQFFPSVSARVCCESREAKMCSVNSQRLHLPSRRRSARGDARHVFRKAGGRNRRLGR